MARVLRLFSVPEIETALYRHELFGIGGKRGRHAPGSKQYHLYPQLSHWEVIFKVGRKDSIVYTWL
jgi:hypothetical protein